MLFNIHEGQIDEVLNVNDARYFKLCPLKIQFKTELSWHHT